jgi:hypothetical protein
VPLSANDSATQMLDLFLWPLQAMREWSDFVRLAPHTLTQSILQGWTLGNVYNINESNSNAPGTEQEILRQHSYGRQLGRITDALSVMVDRAMQDEQLSEAERTRLAGFTKLAGEIQEIKDSEALKRTKRMADHLDELRKTRPELYAKAVAVLEPVLPKAR